MSEVITAAEMQEGQVYKTCETENLSYFAKVVAKGEKVTISAMLPKSGKWKNLEVPGEYKVRALTEAEVTEFAALSQPKVKKERAPRDPNAPKKPAIQKMVGAVSGKGMIAAWAHYINEYVRQEGGRTKVIEAMKLDFPTKEESINKWVDAYLTYYNTGRFKAHGIERQAQSLPWILSEAEKAAGIKKRPVKNLTKAEEPAAVPAV